MASNLKKCGVSGLERRQNGFNWQNLWCQLTITEPGQEGDITADDVKRRLCIRLLEQDHRDSHGEEVASRPCPQSSGVCGISGGPISQGRDLSGKILSLYESSSKCK